MRIKNNILGTWVIFHKLMQKYWWHFIWWLIWIMVLSHNAINSIRSRCHHFSKCINQFMDYLGFLLDYLTNSWTMKRQKEQQIRRTDPYHLMRANFNVSSISQSVSGPDAVHSYWLKCNQNALCTPFIFVLHQLSLPGQRKYKRDNILR